MVTLAGGSELALLEALVSLPPDPEAAVAEPDDAAPLGFAADPVPPLVAAFAVVPGAAALPPETSAAGAAGAAWADELLAALVLIFALPSWPHAANVKSRMMTTARRLMPVLPP